MLYQLSYIPRAGGGLYRVEVAPCQSAKSGAVKGTVARGLVTTASIAAFLAGGLDYGHAALAGTIWPLILRAATRGLSMKTRRRCEATTGAGRAPTPPDQNRRIGEINAVLASLNEERGILDSVCSSDADKAPLFAQIAAITAVGLALNPTS